MCITLACRGEAGHKPLAKNTANKTNKRQATLGGQLAANHRARIAAGEISSSSDEGSSSDDQPKKHVHARASCMASMAPTFLALIEELDLSKLPSKSAVIGNSKR
jgi:hypothetical protein